MTGPSCLLQVHDMHWVHIEQDDRATVFSPRLKRVAGHFANEFLVQMD